jgi:hypothetical protein
LESAQFAFDCGPALLCFRGKTTEFVVALLN